MNLLFGVEMASLVDRGRQGAELRQRFICAARQRAGGRRRGRQAGPKAGSGERSGSEGSHWHTCPGICGGQRRTQSPNGASRIRKAPVETLVSQAPQLIDRDRYRIVECLPNGTGVAAKSGDAIWEAGTKSPAERTCPQARSTAGVFVKGGGGF